MQDSRHTYRLRFTDLGRDLPCDTEFEAAEDYRALQVARTHALNRSVKFHRNGQHVATIRNLPGGLWQIDPPTSDDQPA